MTWLVTGGAGYIGSHVVDVLRRENLPVVVLDDLSSGDSKRLPPDVPLVKASIAERDTVSATLRRHEVRGIIHLAAKKAVEESMTRPLYYYSQNVSGLIALLEAGVETGIEAFLFSSSAAVYGSPSTSLVSETALTRPENPYGETKLVGEWLVRDTARAHGFAWAALRYFNVVGAGRRELADTGVHNLVPKVFAAVDAHEAVQVYGHDYPTPDGTCIRDYIHVSDLAEAHATTAATLATRQSIDVLNIGRSKGVSVLQVLDAIGEVVGREVPRVFASRRPGDSARVVADAERARQVLGWSARQNLQAMVASAWDAWDSRRTAKV
jgi:UDP-glucose 4-epimerase